MQGIARKVVQAVLYEAVGVVFVAPVLAMVYGQGMAYSTALSLVISAVALSWNMLFNLGFERWEARQASRTRTLRRRLLHSLGFEGGLTLILVPLIAAWLNIDWLTALATDVALFVFFFFYALGFQWVFDRVFDVPESAREIAQPHAVGKCP
ncbi:PACE efflux transporter [Pseudomonas sp. LS1212]|uniref:PACE efflux transporter n=1 Tax=Pseudomonas sp. LS1212 TaxID=2972478 RepID=UPI00215C4666|nr:PACE efflux transporter [Pseudomonas sp. LS1212]UVJ46089.1 PACE efflux transporter [Pseudomonas sp. LS1212]